MDDEIIRLPDVPEPPPAAAAPFPPPEKRQHHVVDRTGPNWDEDGEYKVGKNRPPAQHRWQKGQSGNPRGPKPKEKLDPAAEFDRSVLNEFEAVVNGERVKLTLGTFGLQLIKTAAAKGDRKAQEYLVSLYLSRLRPTSSDDATPEVAAREQEMIDVILGEAGFGAQPVIRKSREQAPDDEVQS